jgi:Holliday junction DNA helicase RuvB
MSIGSSILEFITGFSDIIFKKEDNIGEEPAISEQKTAQELYIQQPNQPVKFQYRPKNFEEYISQEKAKDKVKLTIDLIIRGFPKNFLLMGNSGHGKTTLAGIIANTLGFKFNIYVGSCFDIDTMNDFLIKNEKSAIPNILFIDEAGELDKKTLTYMLPLIEDFKFDGVDLRKFITILATTDSYVISKRCPAFLTRVTTIYLEDYTVDDLKILLKQYNSQIHKANISDEDYEILAKNVRFNPRIALLYLDYLVACGNLEKVLKMNRIIKDGLDDIDIRILEFLKNTGKPVGEESISIISNMTRAEYKELREPYLLRSGLLSRTNKGRILTDKGLLFLQGLNK